MASNEQVAWLREGAESWNQKRCEQGIRPDLRGADLREFNLADADLTDANLQDADLTDANLQDAVLTDALLSGARLEGADLTKSKIWQADLWSGFPPGSENWTTTLPNRHEEVDGINDFIDKFNKLRDDHATEEGVEFYFRGEPKDTWNLTPSVMRREGPDGDLRNAEGEMLVHLRSRRTEDFVEATSALDEMVIARHYGLPTRLLDVTHNPLVALFNACEDEEQQSNATENRRANKSEDWPEPESAGRVHIFAVPRFLVKPFNSDTVSIITNFARLRRGEQNLLLGKTCAETEDDAAPGYRSEFPHDPSYGEVMNRLYQFIRLEKPSFAERIRPQDLFRVFVVEPKQSFERIRAQSGAFLISAFHERFEERSVRNWCCKLPLYHHYTWAIPGGSKKILRRHLETFNITRETMLPSLDEAARATRRRYSSRKQ